MKNTKQIKDWIYDILCDNLTYNKRTQEIVGKKKTTEKIYKLIKNNIKNS
jgi:hypothetical protein